MHTKTAVTTHITQYSNSTSVVNPDYTHEPAGFAFSWHYAEHLARPWFKRADGFTRMWRCIWIQVSFAGQITMPVPAVMDDFGNLVAVGEPL